MAKIVLFREELWPTNETFIQNQVSLVKNHSIQYVGLKAAEASLLLNRPALLLSPYGSRHANWRSQAYRLFPSATAFHRKIREFRPELIHAHFSQNATTALGLARSLRVPMIVTLHGSFEAVPLRKLIRGLGSCMYTLRKRDLGRYTSMFLCVSEFVRQKAQESGYPSTKLRVHYIGVDTKYFSPAGDACDPNLIVFVGRLAEKKGCEYFLRAMKTVKKSRPESRALVIGDGELRGALEKLNSELGSVADFLGSQNPETVRDTMRRARMVCVPSVTASSGDVEGLPTVLCEALATGTPAVTTKHAGIPEIVEHGKTGFLSGERDYELLAQHITSILDSDQLWMELSRNSRQTAVKRFDLENQTRILEDLYSIVLNQSILSNSNEVPMRI